MTTNKAKILSSFKNKDDAAGILQCLIPSTEDTISPTDMGDVDPIVPVIYTSPYSFHSDGGFIAIGHHWEKEEDPTGFTDMIILKTDSKGNELWQTIIGTPDKRDSAIFVGKKPFL